jgi:signal transduction histidine kinase
VLLAALVGAFAYVVVDSQSQSRHQSERRFDAASAITAQLTASLFTASASSSQAAAAKAFGGKVVNDETLANLPKNSGMLYTLILDQNGKVIASSPHAPVRTQEDSAATHIREALAGRPSLSDVIPASAPGKANVLEWALPFKTAFGRRVEIQALDATLISKFLTSYLGESQTDAHGVAFVLDSRNRVIGAAGGVAQVAKLPKEARLLSALAQKSHGTYHDDGATRYFASSPVQGSTWKVVSSVPTDNLYGPLSGSKRWFLFLILGAFALAGGASLVFFRRALVNGMKLAHANRELTVVNATLEERVAERTAEVEERAKELARSNEELEQFSSVASHDLQEPLRKIRMFGDRLRDRLGDTLSEEPAADLQRMSKAAERMQQLINDLLDFSRVNHRGKAFEPVDLAKVTREVVADLEARVVELNASVNVGDLPTIEADKTQMRQLMQNLVGNALKFHREDERPLVRISAEESAAGDQCVITIEDNGIGFDEKHSERVFTAFERLHSRSSYEGTGIGLSIARKIVWRHGGHIAAQGTPGKGATFTVTLPLSQSNGRHGKQ